MKEGISSAERQPPTGIDRVLKETLYANVRFPQAGFGIAGFTLNALFTDPDPKKMIREYLDTSLSDEKIKGMISIANRAHMAYLSEEKRPTLTEDGIRILWRAEQKMVQEFLRLMLEKGEIELINEDRQDEEKERVLSLLASEELPIAEVKETFAAFMQEFRRPETQELLTKYREGFKGEGSKDFQANWDREKSVKKAVIDGMQAQLSREDHAVTERQAKMMNFLSEMN